VYLTGWRINATRRLAIDPDGRPLPLRRNTSL
jgi:hypothetical protein